MRNGLYEKLCVTFLVLSSRDNLEWLARATNWAKFTATASLGVIHKVMLHSFPSVQYKCLTCEHQKHLKWGFGMMPAPQFSWSIARHSCNVVCVFALKKS